MSGHHDAATISPLDRPSGALRTAPRVVSPAAVASVYAMLWLGCLAIAVLFGRVLYGDGAYFLLQNLLEPLRFNDYDVHRSFASLLTQAPILLGQRLGFQTVASYAALYGLGSMVLPALLFLVALFLARRQAMLFAATASAVVVFGFGVNFINTEANLFFALAWFATVILAMHAPHPNVRGLLLPVIAFVLLRVYEGMLLAGPVLLLWCISLLNRPADVREKIGLTIAALLFLLGAVIGLGGFLAPRDPSNATRFAGSAMAYLGNPQSWLLLSAFSLAPLFLASRRVYAMTCVLASVACAIVFLFRLYYVHGYYAYTMYYENRSLLALLLPVCIAVVFVTCLLRPEPMLAGDASRRVVVLLIPAVAAVAGDSLGTYRWHRHVDTFCSVLQVNDAAGVQQLKRTGSLMGWAWTHPTMSVLLRAHGSTTVVLDEPGQWQAFDPGKPVSIGYRGFCEAPLWPSSSKERP